MHLISKNKSAMILIFALIIKAIIGLNKKEKVH